MSIARKMAEFAFSLCYDALPEGVVATARRHLADSMACMLGMTEYAEAIPSPTERYAADYIKSEEAEERRLSFIERRSIDPSKNLPVLRINHKAAATGD